MNPNIEVRERGGCLTLWLIVSAGATIFALVTFIGLGSQIGGLLNTGVVLFAAMLVFIAGTWNWKRWGVYGLVVSTFLSNGYQILNGIRAGTNVVQMFVQLAILYFLINPKWEQFE